MDNRRNRSNFEEANENIRKNLAYTPKKSSIEKVKLVPSMMNRRVSNRHSLKNSPKPSNREIDVDFGGKNGTHCDVNGHSADKYISRNVSKDPSVNNNDENIYEKTITEQTKKKYKDVKPKYLSNIPDRYANETSNLNNQIKNGKVIKNYK